MFALADCNAFYASCEQVFNRKLKNKPVVVLSNNDGCIVARSKEAKPLVGMGVPLFEVGKTVKDHKIAVYSSNYPLYADMSQRVVNTLRRFVLDLEVYSIDEVFLDLRNYLLDIETYAEELRGIVLQWTGLPTSIGVSLTKTLSKVANKLAKKSEKGVYVLKNEWEIREALANFDVADIWGIGRQYAKFLKKNGIHNALQLREQSDGWIKKYLTIVGLRMAKELRGEPCLTLELLQQPKKNILVSRTFPYAEKDYTKISERIAFFAARCAEKLRAQKSCANLISVFIRTDEFKQAVQYSNSQMLRFKIATDYTPEIIHYALRAFKKIYREFEYRKAGVMLTGIVPNDQVQGNLFVSFNAAETQKKKEIMKTIDRLNSSMGKNAVRLAAMGLDNLFQSKQSRLSQRFTTCWEELLSVKI